jgi:hypothetical protein
MGEVLSSPIDLDIRNSQHWGPAPQGAPDIDHRQRGVGAAIVLIQVDGLFKVGNGCREVSFGESPVVFHPRRNASWAAATPVSPRADACRRKEQF